MALREPAQRELGLRILDHSMTTQIERILDRDGSNQASLLERTVHLGLATREGIDLDPVIEVPLADDAGRGIRTRPELREVLERVNEPELFPELTLGRRGGRLGALDEARWKLPQARVGGPLPLQQRRSNRAPQVDMAGGAHAVVRDDDHRIERCAFDGIVDECLTQASVGITRAPAPADDAQKARTGRREIFERLEHDLGQRKVEFRHALGRWVAGFGHAGYIARATRGESIPMLRTFLILVSLSAVTLSAPMGARAQDKAGEKAKPKKQKLDVGKLKKDLESGDKARIGAALDAIQASGDATAAPLVEAFLKKGASADLTVKALGAAAALKQASSSAAIAPYVKHRTGDVRHAATKALLKTKGPEAVKALKAGLRSSDALVRGLSATGLGSLGAKDALDDLFTALAHHVNEAAGAIGQLCEPANCEKFAKLTGKHPFDVMATGFDQILFRSEKDMPEDQKIKIIGRCRELGTKESGKYMVDVQSRWPKEWSKKVKQAIDSAVKATGGSSGGGDDD